MNIRLAVIAFFTCCWSLIGFEPSAALAGPNKLLRIGIVADGKGALSIKQLALIRKETLALTQGEFDVQFPSHRTLFGNFDGKRIVESVSSLMTDPAVDLVITIGPLSSHIVARQSSFAKPVIASHVLDPEAQGILQSRGKSGVKNLTYLTTPLGMERSIQAFLEIHRFRHLAFILNRIYMTTFPGIGASMIQRLANIGVKLSFIPLGDPVPEACDAAMVAILPDESPEAVQALMNLLNKRRLFSFSPMSRELVSQGILAGFSLKGQLERRARRVALTIQRILLGEDPASFNVSISYGPPLLTLNMNTARIIGYQPTWDILSEAELIGRKRGPQTARRLSIKQAVEEALRANLNLIAAHKSVEAGIYNVRKAISRYLPRLEASAVGRIIDEDHANPMFGAYERSLTGSARVSQLLWSEKALAGISAEKSLQLGREHGLEQLELDIMAAVASAYMNLLRARTLERIQKENLKVTKKNLELAQVRRAIGASGPADMFRWESQLANDKQAVIRAVSLRNQAEINLNGLRHRPLEEPFSVEDKDLVDATGWGPSQTVAPYINNPYSFAMMREFMVDEGLRNAPEIQQLDRGIEARQRLLLSAKLDYALPTLSFSFGLDHIFWSGGASSSLSIPGMTGVSAPDDTSWNANFALSWTLFDGGAKIHNHLQHNTELSRLRTLRADLAQQIEQRIRSSMHQAGSSYPAIKLSRSAAETARKSLDLVTEAYSRGSRSIIDLIDAQNTALRTDLAAAVAVYDFCLDLIAAMRAVANREYLQFNESANRRLVQRILDFKKTYKPIDQ